MSLAVALSLTSQCNLISVLQRLAKFVWFCSVRCDNVLNSLGRIIDYIHCDFGFIFGCGLS